MKFFGIAYLNRVRLLAADNARGSNSAADCARRTFLLRFLRNEDLYISMEARLLRIFFFFLFFFETCFVSLYFIFFSQLCVVFHFFYFGKVFQFIVSNSKG